MEVLGLGVRKEKEKEKEKKRCQALANHLPKVYCTLTLRYDGPPGVSVRPSLPYNEHFLVITNPAFRHHVHWIMSELHLLNS